MVGFLSSNIQENLYNNVSKILTALDFDKINLESLNQTDTTLINLYDKTKNQNLYNFLQKKELENEKKTIISLFKSIIEHPEDKEQKEQNFQQLLFRIQSRNLDNSSFLDEVRTALSKEDLNLSPDEINSTIKEFKKLQEKDTASQKITTESHSTQAKRKHHKHSVKSENTPKDKVAPENEKLEKHHHYKHHHKTEKTKSHKDTTITSESQKPLNSIQPIPPQKPESLRGSKIESQPVKLAKPELPKNQSQTMETGKPPVKPPKPLRSKDKPPRLAKHIIRPTSKQGNNNNSLDKAPRLSKKKK